MGVMSVGVRGFGASLRQKGVRGFEKGGWPQSVRKCVSCGSVSRPRTWPTPRRTWTPSTCGTTSPSSTKRARAEQRRRRTELKG
eukprot:1736128-Rhodomonas_salina.2